MATYQEVFALRYNNEVLRRQTAVAVAKAAFDVLNEDPLTANHANRVNWAKFALKSTADMVERMMWGVVSNSTIQAQSGGTDSDIQFVVNSLIPSVADGSW